MLCQYDRDDSELSSTEPLGSCLPGLPGVKASCLSLDPWAAVGNACCASKRCMEISLLNSQLP